MKLEAMENRVFGCPEFSDAVFNSSLAITEKILDHILEVQYVMEDNESSNKVLKIGFYANESNRNLEVMGESFDNDELYQERFASYFKPGYMKDPIDYYLTHKINPKVV